MSTTDATAPGGGTPPPAPAAPAAPAAAPPPADPGEPSWMKPRLEQAQRAGERAILEKLGLSDTEIDKAKARLEAARAAEEAEKTATQRALEADGRAKEAADRATRAEAIAKEHATRMMAVLSEERQTAVREIAGEDPALQLRAIHALGKTWAAEADKATADKGAAKPPPATTAPPPNAPGGTDPNSPPDHRAVYETLNNNPFARAVYGARHPEAYTPRK